jgi:hypothetical protein
VSADGFPITPHGSQSRAGVPTPSSQRQTPVPIARCLAPCPLDRNSVFSVTTPCFSAPNVPSPAQYATADPGLPAAPFRLHFAFMSTTEILAQLPRLTPEERDLVRSRLDDIDSAAPLTPAEKQLVDQRVAAYRQNPDAGVSWAVAEAEIRKQIGL